VSFAASFVTNSADAAIGHAERGVGLTMVLAYQVVDALKAGRLEVVLPNTSHRRCPSSSSTLARGSSLPTSERSSK
jgi:DNA-binding transcriptional LysR family regulator